MADLIRILIVDGHAAARAVIGRLLAQEDDLELVGEAESGREAVFEARALKPDVILIDVVMPDQTGLEVLPSLVRGLVPNVLTFVLGRFIRRTGYRDASG